MFRFCRATLAAMVGVFVSTTALAIPVPGQPEVPPVNDNPLDRGGDPEDVGAIPPGLPTETKTISRRAAAGENA